MGVKNPTTTRKNNLNDIFVDREPQRHAFKRHLLEIQRTGINADGMILIYSGVGGIGKTLLFNEFEKLAAAQGKQFVRYDFAGNNTNPITALKNLRQELVKKYQMEFPLFDKGLIYFAQKDGFVSSEQIKNVLKSSSLFRSFKKKISSANTANDMAAGAAKIGDGVLNDDGGIWDSLETLAQNALEVTPFVKFAKPVLNFIDEMIARNEEFSRKKNDVYKQTAEELEARNQNDSAYIEEFLPTLFARDLTFWLEKNKTDLIIFLDTYEKLTGEEGGNKKVRLRSENRDVPVDWWVGELLAADRVMWVIAGRYKLKKIGEVDLKYCGQLENYTVDVFDKHWANKYLERLGIEEADLRQKIIDVTGGHPFYLNKCFITYDNKRGEKLQPSDFGENQDEVIARAVGTLNEAGQFMAQNLCILGRWTDEIAAEVIDSFNNVTYKRIKNLFARADSSSLADEKLYTFDRTIDAFFFPGLKSDVTCRRLFADIRTKADAYFKKFFGKIFVSYEKRELYLGMWSDILLRTTDKPADLMTLYEENFVPLENRFDYSTWATIIQKFLDKIGDANSLPHAYFQDRLGRIRFDQDRIKEALELSEAAYSEVKDLPLSNTERPFKFSIMRGLAEVFQRLERYTNEISLCKEMISECERYLPNDIDTIIEMKNALADALEMCDRKNESFEIRRQIVESLEERGDERYIDEAAHLAKMFGLNFDNKSSLALKRKLVAFCEKKGDEYSLIRALRGILFTLDVGIDFSGREYLEEKAAYYRRLVTIHEKRGDDTSYLLEDFAETLKKLGLDDEAAQISERLVANSAREAEDLQRRIDDLQRRIESVDTPNAKTVELMIDCDNLMWNANADEATRDSWKEKVNETIRAIIERTCREPVANYDAAIETLNDLFFWGWGYEDIALKRNILALTEKKSDATVEEIIAAKKELVMELRTKDNLTDADKAEVDKLFKELENYYRQDLPASREDLLDTLNNHAGFLNLKLNNIHAALEKYEEIFALFENDSDMPPNEIISRLESIDDMLVVAENYSEEIIWRERILNFCRAHLVENAPETLEALEHLIHACDNLNDRDAAERYRQQLIAAKEKNLGSSHIEVIKIKEWLAEILHDAEKYDDEIALREQIVELYRENFRANTSNKTRIPLRNFIRALENLTDCLDETGQLKKSVAVRKQFISELKESPQGDLDAWTIECLIRDLQRVGDYDEELRYRRELVDLRRAKDPESETTRYEMEELAEAYERCDKEDAALEVYKQLAEIHGADCPLRILDKIGDKERADAVRREIIDDARRFIEKNRERLGDTNKKIIRARKDIAKCLEDLGEYDAAVKVHQEILRLFNGETCNYRDVLVAETHIADLRVKMGDFSALKTLAENCNLIIAEGGKVGDLPQRIADAFEAIDDYDRALTWRRKVVERSYCATTVCELADTLDKANRHAEATAERIQLLEKLNAKLEKIIDIYGADSCKTKLTLKKFAKIRDKISGDSNKN